MARRGVDVRYAKEIRRVLVLTLLANLGVVIAKLVVGLAAGSLAVLAEAGHSGLDALNNVVALALARVASAAPDDDHPYGHGKFETLGALGIVAFLSVTVFRLVEGAVRRLVEGSPGPDVGWVLVIVVAASALVSLGVSRYEARRGHELGSALLVADAVHTRTDVWGSLAVLAGLGVSALGYPEADAIVALLVAGIIGIAGYRVLRSTVPVLVDERAEDPALLRRVALQVDGVRAAYDVRSRGRPGESFAELTIAVDPSLDVAAAHRIADEVEVRVGEEMLAREVVVHVEPGGAAAVDPRGRA
ncbi:MAG TPA: cation diffusion facilitator family transporter [Longimicrobiales bacterium]|nr:cation diffusion facilitator family transporter [Longimicrobiales bacterium]